MRSKSKRLKFAIALIGVNILIGVIGIICDVNLATLGMGLSMINSPFYVYIVGDTIRPAKDYKKGLIPISKRFKFSVIMLTFNYLAYVVAILLDAHMYNVAVFLSSVNTPLFAYVLGDSFRPVKVDEKYVGTVEPDLSIEIKNVSRDESQD